VDSVQPPLADGGPTPDRDESRPVSVTAAAGILLLVGVLAGLVGLVLLIVVFVNANPAALPSYIEAAPDGFAGAAGAIGLILLAYGVAGAVAAMEVLRRRGWARGLGIGLALLGTIVLVVAVIRPGQATGATPIIFVPVIGALAYAAVALATEGRWFGSSAPGPGTG
jgi:hypothetical protein